MRCLNRDWGLPQDRGASVAGHFRVRSLAGSGSVAWIVRVVKTEADSQGGRLAALPAVRGRPNIPATVQPEASLADVPDLTAPRHRIPSARVGISFAFQPSQIDPLCSPSVARETFQSSLAGCCSGRLDPCLRSSPQLDATGSVTGGIGSPRFVFRAQIHYRNSPKRHELRRGWAVGFKVKHSEASRTGGFRGGG
jgi:hypothetical protein